MIVQHYFLADEKDTIALASKLTPCLTFPLTMTLSGEIGAGKTSFVRALLRALGVTGAIKSPTFSLVESYSCQDLLIHHFDLYRIHDEAELDYIGFREFFTEQSFCCIEWPERAPHSVSHVDVRGLLAIKGDGRLMSLYASTVAGEAILTCLADQQ